MKKFLLSFSLLSMLLTITVAYPQEKKIAKGPRIIGEKQFDISFEGRRVKIDGLKDSGSIWQGEGDLEISDSFNMEDAILVYTNKPNECYLIGKGKFGKITLVKTEKIVNIKWSSTDISPVFESTLIQNPDGKIAITTANELITISKDTFGSVNYKKTFGDFPPLEEKELLLTFTQDGYVEIRGPKVVDEKDNKLVIRIGIDNNKKSEIILDKNPVSVKKDSL